MVVVVLAGVRNCRPPKPTCTRRSSVRALALWRRIIGDDRGVERTEGGIVAAKIVSWVDEPVEVELVTREENRAPQQTRYTLEGADQRGILLGYLDERDLSSEYRILFFPWHRIERIHLLTPGWE